MKAKAAVPTARKARQLSRNPITEPREHVRSEKEDSCYNCSKDLGGDVRALYVEEEIGRIFCSEGCIAKFFGPEIERLEKEFVRRSTSGDLTGTERESLAHLRWITLEEPDEVWREKTLTGDFRYTLISEFQPGDKKIWSICICLFLRGEPSFLYIAFPTKNAAMANAYRRGERMRWEKSKKGDGSKKSSRKTPLTGQGFGQEFGKEQISEHGHDYQEAQDAMAPAPSDRLANAWTEDETFLAQMNMERSETDIAPEQFDLYQGCVEQTLETPDEVWSLEMSDPEGVHLYHFIRHYPEEEPGHWYIIVAKETEDEEQIEILDAFPTRDATLVERYRRGEQEVGDSLEIKQPNRMVH